MVYHVYNRDYDPVQESFVYNIEYVSSSLSDAEQFKNYLIAEANQFDWSIQTEIWYIQESVPEPTWNVYLSEDNEIVE